jgi:hypothetical protein
MRKKEVFTREEAYQKSIKALKNCITPYGFLASAAGKDNYGRVWSRDGIICGLAALMSQDKELIECFKNNLNTLMKFQHGLGFIPSNVDFTNGKVSYGGTAGRVDASLWYVIGVSQYFKRTRDTVFLKSHSKSLAKVMRLLPFWEFNDKHFLYVPMGGDWADQYVNEGYVLYDELLYLQANREYAYLKKKLKGKYQYFQEKAQILEKRIGINYWLQAKNYYSDRVYNKVIFQKGIRERGHKKDYLLPYFNPGGYGKRFDGFANSLAIHFRVLSRPKQRMIINYVDKKFTKRTKNLVPAFWPPIKQGDAEWKKLKNNYSVKFRNKPYHYHNGGLWPFINGFYASAIARINRKRAREHLDAINWANYKSKGKGRWGLYEFLDSKYFRAGGMKHQAWSAAGGIMAHEAVVNNKAVFLRG